MKFPGHNHMVRISQRMIEDVNGYSPEERTTFLLVMRAMELMCDSPLTDVNRCFLQASKEVDKMLMALHQHQRHGIA